ncbi:hypothetical protein BED46_019985 [Burkholderia contaminans]|uniref:Uncharacterized protein n=2 Tax=Burkholderia contaminans TaxID=488447 RepID=A0A250LL04_9BURK|nr:hypothetical protein WR31_10820 [Burkholderia contaminans LMG 23361]OMI80534.1 hypothetical protein BED46_019985 [Burkholderia contaminans]BBA44579.1 hypothetical protein BCCH1_70830 [Burkholderia contaminans]GLZ70709.1 hypothetical protein Bcon01_37540 [Burkholderia contaminans]
MQRGDGPGHRFAVTNPFACFALKQFRQSVTMTTDGKLDEFPSDTTSHTTGRLSFSELVGTITLDGFARADARVPGTQDGQGSGVGKGERVRKNRHPKVIGFGMTAV